MKSMTGYGISKEKSNQTEIEVAVRSVNGRFREIRYHAPREYAVFESEVKKIIESHFSRSTIDVYINRKTESPKKKLIFNKDLADQYIELANKLVKTKKLKALSVADLIQNSDVVSLQCEEVSIEKEKKILFKALEQACKKNYAERSREGKSIVQDIQDHLHVISEAIKKIIQLRSQSDKDLEEKLLQRLKARLVALNEHSLFDHQRLSQEVSILLEKSDINEELSRLKEHIKNYSEILTEQDGVGKKLDFYTQELLREINTIGSKSNHMEITQLVVEIKTRIERLREQVQNLE